MTVIFINILHEFITQRPPYPKGTANLKSLMTLNEKLRKMVMMLNQVLKYIFKYTIPTTKPRHFTNLPLHTHDVH